MTNGPIKRSKSHKDIDKKKKNKSLDAFGRQKRDAAAWDAGRARVNEAHRKKIAKMRAITNQVEKELADKRRSKKYENQK